MAQSDLVEKRESYVVVFAVLYISHWCGIESLSFRGGAAGGGGV